jgi:hypothetical protein
MVGSPQVSSIRGRSPSSPGDIDFADWVVLRPARSARHSAQRPSSGARMVDSMSLLGCRVNSAMGNWASCSELSAPRSRCSACCWRQRVMTSPVRRVVRPGDWEDWWLVAAAVVDPSPKGLAAVTGFAIGAFNTSRNWNDNSYLRYPGHRDRTVLIRQSRAEGGLNLYMSTPVIFELADRGREAASVMVERYTTPQFPKGRARNKALHSLGQSSMDAVSGACWARRSAGSRSEAPGDPASRTTDLATFESGNAQLQRNLNDQGRPSSDGNYCQKAPEIPS